MILRRRLGEEEKSDLWQVLLKWSKRKAAQRDRAVSSQQPLLVDALATKRVSAVARISETVHFSSRFLQYRMLTNGCELSDQCLRTFLLLTHPQMTPICHSMLARPTGRSLFCSKGWLPGGVSRYNYAILASKLNKPGGKSDIT